MSLFIAKSVLPAVFLLGAGNFRVYNDDFARSQKENFKNNNVKAVTGWTFTFLNGTPVKKGVKSSEERFDKKGNRIEEIWFDEKGVSEMETSFSYNEEGIELKNVGMKLHRPFYNNWIYEYNDTIGEVTRYHSQHKINKEKWIFNYNAAGNKIQEQYFDDNGLSTSRFVFNYDSQGRLSEKIEFDSYDNLYRKWAYVYDEKGNNISEIQYNADAEILRQFTLKYDSKGNLTTRVEMDPKGITLQMTVFLYEFYTSSK